MKFRTRIWMLPLSAAFVFTVGILLSVFVSSGTSSRLDALDRVGNPKLEAVLQLDRKLEQFRLALQSAAQEGDDSKLGEADTIAADVQQLLVRIGQIEGQAPVAADLRAGFDGYRAAGMKAVKGMLDKTGTADQVPAMQAALAAFGKSVQAQETRTRVDIQSEFAAARDGVRRNVLVALVTGVVALVVLAGASMLLVRSLWRDLGGEPGDLRSQVQRVSQGELTGKITLRAGDGTSLAAAVASMVQRLRGTVQSIHAAATSIHGASDEIASGNQDLSVRTETAASSLQQTASSMQQLTAAVQQSAGAAQQANLLATQATEAARRGGDIVGGVVERMNEIDAASRRIQEIIGVIDGIAFQTNILALNAAVEAARAGEQGRGFAVVASEVRGLAQRSTQAAREIKTLIQSTSDKVDSGSRQVQEAGTAMAEIQAGVSRVTTMIGEITRATAEQSDGIGRVNGAVGGLEDMTQQNAALVEESAAAAESLRSQAGRLSEAVAQFSL